MINFKEETYEAILSSRHKREDIMFIGSSDGKYRINMDKFDEISDFEYNNDFVFATIAIDLIIYFKDGTYITRGEDDYGEWWNYNTPKMFSEDDDYKDFDFLGGKHPGLDTLEKINNKWRKENENI